MEDKKNAMRLDDEKLEQVAGGSGDGTNDYTGCPVYQFLCAMKELYNEEMFHNLVVNESILSCPDFKDVYDCRRCDVHCKWLR